MGDASLFSLCSRLGHPLNKNIINQDLIINDIYPNLPATCNILYETRLSYMGSLSYPISKESTSMIS